MSVLNIIIDFFRDKIVASITDAGIVLITIISYTIEGLEIEDLITSVAGMLGIVVAFLRMTLLLTRLYEWFNKNFRQQNRRQEERFLMEEGKQETQNTKKHAN